ncbi:MAG: hypothetical protein JW954_00525 [Dehalococcoidaceae bacterium]|nr:hypothetical protein [Dehalococcoidaceae bacterium]
MFLFWVENVIIGFFNILKMMLAPPDKSGKWGTKLSLIPFFCLHYGIFTLVHGVMVVAIFSGIFAENDLFAGIASSFESVFNAAFGWAVAAVFSSHAISFGLNYIAGGEYKTTNLSRLMAEPYGRVIVLHITLLFGGFIVMAMDSPVIGLVLFILLKIIIDIRSHIHQHRGLSAW